MSMSTTTYAAAQCVACQRNFGTTAVSCGQLVPLLEAHGWWGSAFLKLAVCNDCREKLRRIHDAGLPVSELLPTPAEVSEQLEKQLPY